MIIFLFYWCVRKSGVSRVRPGSALLLPPMPRQIVHVAGWELGLTPHDRMEILFVKPAILMARALVADEASCGTCNVVAINWLGNCLVAARNIGDFTRCSIPVAKFASQERAREKAALFVRHGRKCARRTRWTPSKPCAIFFASPLHWFHSTGSSIVHRRTHCLNGLDVHNQRVHIS